LGSVMSKMSRAIWCCLNGAGEVIMQGPGGVRGAVTTGPGSVGRDMSG
jgi:hypothetical protein